MNPVNFFLNIKRRQNDWKSNIQTESPGVHRCIGCHKCRLRGDVGDRRQSIWTVGPVIPTWPQFTMVYETDGAAIAIGQNPAEITREVRRLEYQSETQWTDTVIEAPTIETRVGQFSGVGSYKQLNGKTLTEFDAMDGYTDETTETTLEEGTTTSTIMPPFPIEESGIECTPIATNSRVCFRDQCTDNAEGLLYRKASGSEAVFVNDARGIPLRVGSPSTRDAFIVKEIQIDDTKRLC